MAFKALDYRNIPVQADVISGIVRLDAESSNSFRELDNYLRSDQGVAALVLRVVNSPMYSRGKKIGSIPVAITVLGFNVVRSLAMLAFGRRMFASTRDPLFREHIWQHSLLAGIAGRCLCQALGAEKDKDEAFIAGLMHDMGKVLLFTHDPVRYGAVLARTIVAGESSVVAETSVFGFDHCQVGREAARQWNLPERFGDYMGCDFASPDSGFASTTILRSVAAANIVLKAAGIGAPPEREPATRQAALLALGLSAELAEKCMQDEFIAGQKDDEVYKLCSSF